MPVPYYVRILLEPYADHAVVGGSIVNGLQGALDIGPMFGVLTHPTNFGMLSSGEQATIHLALALWNGHREATVADLFLMDAAHQQRACDAICAKFLYSTEE